MLLAVTSPCVAALFPSESPKACREALCTRMPSRFTTLLPAVTAQMQSNTATATTRRGRPAALLQRTSHTRTHTHTLSHTHADGSINDYCHSQSPINTSVLWEITFKRWFRIERTMPLYGLELLLVIFRRYSQADSLVRMRMLKTTRKISQLKTIDIFLYDIT